jgi:1,4-dihydroxy-2-naphthoate octaprenyltransferase
MANIQIWFEATRPKTLPAAVAPVVLGTAMAHSIGQFHFLPAVICLAFALLVQIGTNFANDYLDGIKGTDTAARLGPRRAVAAGLVSPSTYEVGRDRHTRLLPSASVSA